MTAIDNSCNASLVELLASLGLDGLSQNDGPGFDTVRSPVDGRSIASIERSTIAHVESALGQSVQAFHEWRQIPAPRRGECVRQLGCQLRENKEALARLVTWESGKIYQEALGEVQEMIDVCDFAVGLSRQLHGLTIVSERPEHRMMEQWHPLGPVAIISAFNFPVAVWAWNAALALVCGNTLIWKPSTQTPLCAVACRKMLAKAITLAGVDGQLADNLCQVVYGGVEVGEALASDRRVALVSATGSTRMGRAVAVKTAQRLGRTLLELGGNNAMVVMPSANLELALRAIVFSAVGTAGQRCTSLRRLLVHEAVAVELLEKLEASYHSLKVGSPFDQESHVGPVVSEASWGRMRHALARAQADGGQLLVGGSRVEVEGLGGTYVEPAIVKMPAQTAIMREETFAPLLYVLTVSSLEEAIQLQNEVSQGLSSAIFTDRLAEAEQFLGAGGSDCGIANVNIGTSGAEIGGAFGGEKDTGGGRESGSDAWKNYMRRATNTINYGAELPLAQGIRFQS